MEILQIVLHFVVMLMKMQQRKILVAIHQRLSVVSIVLTMRKTMIVSVGNHVKKVMYIQVMV